MSSQPGSPDTVNSYSAKHGEIHKKLKPTWSYTPIYINKMEVVDKLLRKYHAGGKMLDAGCAEGVLVEKYLDQGYDIIGLDAGYSTSHVIQGSVTAIPFDNGAFETVLCLDVLEHLQYDEQPQAVSELRRVLKPDGTLIFCIPNMAHFTARLKLMFRGRLLRTATTDHHPGDRTANEFQHLLEAGGFQVVEKKGVFPTVPPVYRRVMHTPARSVGLLRFLRRLPFPVNWCFQVLFVCRPVSGYEPRVKS